MSNQSLMQDRLLVRWMAQQHQSKLDYLYLPERPVRKPWRTSLQVKIGEGLISLGQNLKSNVELSA